MRRRLALALFLAGCSHSDPPRPASVVPVGTTSVAPSATPAKMTGTSESVPPTVDAGPDYDLVADRDARAKTSKAELNGKSAVSVVSDVFVVVGPPGPNYDSNLALFRSAMGAYLNHRFDRKPDHAISVYLFPNAAQYEEFCTKKYNAPCIAHFGFYEPNDRYMVMNIGLGAGTLTHEIVHPLVEADFPQAPTWLNEGIASVFEQPQIPKPGEIHGGKNWRWPRLKKALTTPGERDKAILDHYFGMKDETFRGDDEDLHYATARYICQWLDGQNKLWPFYHRWRDTFATDPTGEKAFKEVMGMTPAEAHPAWRAWVLAL